MVRELAAEYGLDVLLEASTTRELGVNRGVVVKQAAHRRVSASGPRDWRLIRSIDSALRADGSLGDSRIDLTDFGSATECHDHCVGRFFHETALATPVVVPTPTAMAGIAAPFISVWVSDPPYLIHTSDSWTPRGTFLFLVEEALDTASLPVPFAFLSGISSLRAFVDFTMGGIRADFDSARAVGLTPDEFGRDDGRHPLQKLAAAGGAIGLRREIEVTYRVRYLSDEQGFEDEPGHRRLSDVLAYPKYLAI